VNNGVQIFIITPYKNYQLQIWSCIIRGLYFRKEVVYNIRLSYIDWRHKWSPYDTRVLPEDDRAVATSNVHRKFCVDRTSGSRDTRVGGRTNRPPRSSRLAYATLFFSRPRSEGWPHHGRTFSIYPCPLSFWLTLPRRVLSTSWCCQSKPCVAFLASRLRAPGIVPCIISFSLVSSWCDHSMLASSPSPLGYWTSTEKGHIQPPIHIC